MSLTRISESFDDSEHIVDLLVDQHVVHLHSDVLLTTQSVSKWREAAFKTTTGIWFGTTNIPREDREGRGGELTNNIRLRVF